MKRCAYCGVALPDEAAFCSGCGNRVVAAPAYEQPPVPDDDLFVDGVAAEPTPKRGLRWVPILSAVCAVAVLLLAFDFCFTWVGVFSPVGRLARAAMRTVKAGSMTVDFSYKYTRGDDCSEDFGTAKVVIDHKAEEVNYITQYGEEGDEYEEISATSNGREYGYTAKDGTVTHGWISEVDDEEFFDWLEDMEDDVDWEDVIEDAELEDYLDADEMDDFVRKLDRKYFGNRRWLKKNMGYSKKGNTYTFRPDAETLLEALADIVDESDAFTRKGKREVEDGIDELLDDLDDSDVKLDVEISFTVKGRYLSNLHIEYEVEADGEQLAVEMDIDISDVNRTKISKSEVRSVKNTVNEYLEAEGIEYGGCDACGDFGKMYDYYGSDLCSECYYDRKYR